MISSMAFLYFLLFGTLGLMYLVAGQTACQDFGPELITDYPKWSKAHVQTWCEEHDPASTGQCARKWSRQYTARLTNYI